jgi:hypothetical protein
VADGTNGEQHAAGHGQEELEKVGDCHSPHSGKRAVDADRSHQDEEDGEVAGVVVEDHLVGVALVGNFAWFGSCTELCCWCVLTGDCWRGDGGVEDGRSEDGQNRSGDPANDDRIDDQGEVDGPDAAQAGGRLASVAEFNELDIGKDFGAAPRRA